MTSGPRDFRSTRLPVHATSGPRHFRSTPLPVHATSGPHHFRSTSLPVHITSGPHHFRSTSLPVHITSGPHHFRSTSLPVHITSGPHHFRSTSLPVHITSGPHHFRSTSLPVHITSGPHHFRSTSLQGGVVDSFIMNRGCRCNNCLLSHSFNAHMNTQFTTRHTLPPPSLALFIVGLLRRQLIMFRAWSTRRRYKRKNVEDDDKSYSSRHVKCAFVFSSLTHFFLWYYL